MGAHPHRADAARVKVELAQIFARHGAAYQAAHRLIPVQYRAMCAIEACRTERLGGHIERCNNCGALRYHSLDIHQCPHCKAGRMIAIGPIPVPCARAPPAQHPSCTA